MKRLYIVLMSAVVVFFSGTHGFAAPNAAATCYIGVADLAAVNGDDRVAAVVTRRLQEELTSLASSSFSQCRVVRAASLPDDAPIAVTVRGEYIVREYDTVSTESTVSSSEIMLVVRLSTEADNSTKKTVQGTWIQKDTLADELAGVSAKILEFSRNHYAHRRAALRRRTSGAGPKRSKVNTKQKQKQVQFSAAGGYVQPFADLHTIASSGYAVECTAGIDTFLPAFINSRRVSFRVHGGYISYRPAKETVDFLQSFYLQAGIGYIFRYTQYTVLPYAGVGQQVSMMSADSRADATAPFQYTTDTYYQPLLFCALEGAWHYRKVKLFALPSITLCNDGGNAALYGTVKIGAGTSLSWSMNK